MLGRDRTVTELMVEPGQGASRIQCWNHAWHVFTGLSRHKGRGEDWEDAAPHLTQSLVSFRILLKRRHPGTAETEKFPREWMCSVHLQVEVRDDEISDRQREKL